MGRFSSNVCLVVTILTIRSISEVKGHGMLWDPPGRSTAWRRGYPLPVEDRNYNDNELFCGGRIVQWNQNGGKCGVCGDNYADVIKDNESINGKYVINRSITGYYVRGQTIEVTVNLTANHKGWWEFKLCSLKNYDTAVTQDCLDEHILNFSDVGKTRFYLADNGFLESQSYKVKLDLPDDVTCDNCVLQWKYYTGNSWGCSIGPDGEVQCCTGCGSGQETFQNCADIQISGSNSQSTSGPTEKTTKSATLTALISGSTSWESTTIDSTYTTAPPQTSTPLTETITTSTSPTSAAPITTNSPTSTGGPSSTYDPTTQPSYNKICQAIGAHSSQPVINQWCATNCNATPSFCPPAMCLCGEAAATTMSPSVTPSITKGCQAIGSYASQAGMDQWCTDSCNATPSNCPTTICSCNAK
ncbi:hypothetical protein MAR_005669 [Mya arenaria]|uniref:Chitin-binding type-4 domain-containing protein n=1 Tax=Mya arenaria TaxID=6604 RepID=A0ABY7F2Z8_MYAAR|nr:uncharacterized protein LOC128203444 isoform X1 [Mya arenaria]WAR15564.1 hypothetical protein MAR_005669 [Mya arenaria]